MSPEYKEQLAKLSQTLNPRTEPTQGELDFDANSYAEIADCIIERPEIAQLGRTASFGWDSEGTYLEREA